MTKVLRVSQATRGSVNRRIFSAALTVGAFTLIAKGVSMLKDVAVAYRFGTGDVLDAFLLALVVPTIAISVVADSLKTALVPAYIRALVHEGPAAAQDLFRSISALAIVLLIASAGTLALTSSALVRILGGHFSPTKQELTRTLFLLLLPCIVVSGVSNVWSGILNAYDRFALASLSAATVPLAIIGALLITGRQSHGTGLALGTLVGYCAQAVVLGAALRRSGLHLRPRWSGITPKVRLVVQEYVPVLASALLMTGTTIVDQGIATHLEAGSIAILNYGSKVILLVLSLGTMALGTAVLPHFSTLVAQENWAALRHTLRTYVLLVLCFTIPITLAIFLQSRPIVTALFERGAFEARDSGAVAQVQALYALQIPFYTLGILFVRMISSFRENRVLLWGTAVCLPLNAGLDVLLMRWYGLAGIALSTSAVYLFSCVYLGMSLRGILHRAERAAGSHKSQP